MKSPVSGSKSLAGPSRFRDLSTRQVSYVVVLAVLALAAVAAYSTNPAAASLRHLVFGTSAPEGVAPVDPDMSAEPGSIEPAATLTSDLSTARSGHTATLLADGKILVVGGESTGVNEVFDPATGVSSSTENMASGRWGHTATRLSDGRVLVAGGSVDGSAVASTRVYDPATGTFGPGPDMGTTRFGHTATTLSNGKILIAGGDAAASAEVYDPATSSFSTLSGTMTASRVRHSAVLMNDGRVFIAGGDGSNTAEIFNPADATFTATGNGMTLARSHALLRVLPDAKVQIIGGNSDGSMEVYDPSIDTIGAYAHVVPETDQCANLINYVLSAPTRSALIFSGSSVPERNRTGFTVTELGSFALVIGGSDSSGATSTVTRFNSSAATITTDKLDYHPGQTATFTGTGYQAGETVRVMIHEDPHTPQERGFDAVADANGNFTGTYLVQDYDLNMKFVAGARGLTSGNTAQTTFTDNKNFTITFAGTGGGSIAFSGVSPTPPIPSPNPCTGSCNVDLDNNATGTLTVTPNVGSTFVGWSGTFVGGGTTTCTGTALTCTFSMSNAAQALTATFNGNTNTTTTVASSANPSVFGQSVTLTATVTRLTGTGSPTGTVQFIVDGSNFGSPVTLTSAIPTTSTAATSTSALSVGTHTVSATYIPTGGFTGSSGSLSPNQVVNKASTATTITSDHLNPLAWTQILPSGTGPSSSTCAQSTVADGAGRLIVYARTVCGGGTGEVWVLNKANGLGGSPSWSLVASGGPSRHGQTVTYDRVNNRLMLFGGCSGGCLPVTNDVWVLTNANGQGGAAVWTNLSPSGGPPAARNHAAGAYDPATNRMMIFGGQNGSGTVAGQTFADVWVLTNANGLGGTPVWSSLATSGVFPLGQYQSRAFYDSTNNRLTIAGGSRSDTGTASSAVNVLTNANGTGGTPTWSNLIAEGAAGAPAFAGWNVDYNAAANRGVLAQQSTSNLYYLNNANGLGGTTSYSLVTPSGGGGATPGYGLGFDAPTGRTMAWHLNGSTNTSFVLAPASSSTYGDSVTFTANVSVNAPGAGTPTGDIQFYDGASALGAPQPISGGAASIVTSALNAGVHNITAQYAGDTNFNTSTSGLLPHTVAQKTLTASIVGNPTKVYDGNTNATLAPANFSLTGLVGTDNFTVTKTTGSYDSANVGPRTVSTTLATGDFVPAGGTLASNYTLPTTASGPGTITAATTSVVVSAAIGTYGGTVNLTATLTRTSPPLGPLSGKTVNFTLNGNSVGSALTNVSGVASLTGVYLTSNGLAGGTRITVNTYPTGVGASFAAETNYAGSSDDDSLTVNQKSATASFAASNKEYDGNNLATINSCTVAVLESGDVVTCSAAGPNTFDNANVGVGKTVTATNITLSGAASGNYSLSSTSANTTADITTKAITATLTAANKEYDGNTTEPDASMSCALTGVLPADAANITCTPSAGTFNTADVATATQVTATVTVSGLASGNYTLGAAGSASLSSSGLTASANITPKTLSASMIGNPTKSYDGNTNATLVPANFSIAGLVGTESFTVTKTTGSYNDANVATANSVTTSLVAGDFTAGLATLASNYNLPTSASGPGSITRAATTTTVTFEAGPYTYRGTAFTATAAVSGPAGLAEAVTPVNYSGDCLNVTGPNGCTATATYAESPNYLASTDTKSITINKANADCSSITGYTGVYDALAHGASGTCTGVSSETLAGLNLGGVFTNVPGGTANWTFTDVTGNYNDDSGTAAIVINPVTPTLTTTGGTFTYDGNPRASVGTALGVGSVPVSGSFAYTYTPGGASAPVNASATPYGVSAAFTSTDSNYNNGTPAVNTITINKATPTVTVSFPASVIVYDGFAHPATVVVNGVSGVLSIPLNGTTAITYTKNAAPFAGTPTLVGTYTASATFTSTNSNYNNAATTVNAVMVINTACSLFDGFKSPIGGAVEVGTGGSQISPVRAFKLGSTIPVKFSATCFNTPLITGVHTLHVQKWNTTTSILADPIDATPTDAATTGVEFRLTGSEWHYNLDTKNTPGFSEGTWLLKATLFDGTTYTVWVTIKK